MRKRLTARALLLTSLCGVAAAGCSQSSPAPASRGGSATQAAVHSDVTTRFSSSSIPIFPPETQRLTPVDLTVGSLDRLLTDIHAQKDKIVVVDTWATWCKPCQEAFPELIQLSRRHAKDGVVCMSVSVDHLQKIDAARAFLRQVGAHIPNYLVDDSKAWTTGWRIDTLPCVMVIGRDGVLVKKFEGEPFPPYRQFTYADVEMQVTELLQGK